MYAGSKDDPQNMMNKVLKEKAKKDKKDEKKKDVELKIDVAFESPVTLSINANTTIEGNDMHEDCMESGL